MFGRPSSPFARAVLPIAGGIVFFAAHILQNGLFIFNSKIYYQFPQNMVFFFAIKFCLSIGLLILVRGGLPRYRYDYLTKLG
jgi:NADH:ubiquinone oxidoreductase subunit H